MNYKNVLIWQVIIVFFILSPTISFAYLDEERNRWDIGNITSEEDAINAALLLEEQVGPTMLSFYEKETCSQLLPKGAYFVSKIYGNGTWICNDIDTCVWHWKENETKVARYYLVPFAQENNGVIRIVRIVDWKLLEKLENQ